MGEGGCKGEKCGNFDHLFNIYRLKKSIYWRLRKLILKKKKNDLKKLQGEGCVKCSVFIDINTHVSTMYSECVE